VLEFMLIMMSFAFPNNSPILNTTKDCYVNVLGDVLKNNKISVTRKAEYLQKINSNSDKIYCEQKEYLNECFLKE